MKEAPSAIRLRSAQSLSTPTSVSACDSRAVGSRVGEGQGSCAGVGVRGAGGLPREAGSSGCTGTLPARRCQRVVRVACRACIPAGMRHPADRQRSQRTSAPLAHPKPWIGDTARHCLTLSMPATSPNSTPLTFTKTGALQRSLVGPPTLRTRYITGGGMHAEWGGGRRQPQPQAQARCTRVHGVRHSPAPCARFARHWRPPSRPAMQPQAGVRTCGGTARLAGRPAPAANACLAFAAPLRRLPCPSYLSAAPRPQTSGRHAPQNTLRLKQWEPGGE